MKTGTSTIRTSVASASTARVRPRPSIRMNDTWAGINAANEIDITNAAVVTTRPMPAMPKAMLSSVAVRSSAALRDVSEEAVSEEAREASQYSWIRDTRNTS